MNTLALSFLGLAALPSTGTLVGFLIWFGVACIVAWALIALVRSTGVAIPPQVFIVFWALLGIVLLIFIGRLFGAVT